MEFNSGIIVHHIFKETWNPFVGEELQYKMEHGSILDIYVCCMWYSSNSRNVGIAKKYYIYAKVVVLRIMCC